MTDLYQRVLLWHKLLAQVTGGLALCSAKRGLNRNEALQWVEHARNVAEDIEAVLKGGAPVIDDKGRRVVESETQRPSSFFEKEGEQHVAAPDSPTVNGSHIGEVKSKTVSPVKVGGLRVARRKK